MDVKLHSYSNVYNLLFCFRFCCSLKVSLKISETNLPLWQESFWQMVIFSFKGEGLFSRSQHEKILNAMSTSGLAGKIQRNSERFPGSNAAIPGVFLHNNFPTRSSLPNQQRAHWNREGTLQNFFSAYWIHKLNADSLRNVHGPWLHLGSCWYHRLRIIRSTIFKDFLRPVACL